MYGKVKCTTWIFALIRTYADEYHVYVYWWTLTAEILDTPEW